MVAADSDTRACCAQAEHVTPGVFIQQWMRDQEAHSADQRTEATHWFGLA